MAGTSITATIRAATRGKRQAHNDGHCAGTARLASRPCLDTVAPLRDLADSLGNIGFLPAGDGWGSGTIALSSRMSSPFHAL